MRLTRLDIKGFKSFANETVVNFNEDVIGIVGPNGSGKSNIVDAIRWVLGEQKSKELRLEKMSNVIFNGSRKRKPGSIAQVTLTFENTRNVLPTEFQSVAITRMLYRSGESEYRINDVPCRLKDIRPCFWILESGRTPMQSLRWVWWMTFLKTRIMPAGQCSNRRRVYPNTRAGSMKPC